MQLFRRLKHYSDLMRLNKPIGILLLLWPTLWALWLAGNGHPDKKILLIFCAGVILTRSAGCILNDLADRKFDGFVSRTKNRPLVSGAVNSIEAVIIACLLGLTAFLLVLLCNPLTIFLAFIGAGIAFIYPFLKRITYLPQLGLGIAFAWGVPMAFAAQTGSINSHAWVLFFASMLWPIIYDTLYAMVDREDDYQIGVKSTALLFAHWDLFLIGALQFIFILLLGWIGHLYQLSPIYYTFLGLAFGLFFYQQWLIKDRDPSNCFAAFLNNNWVGALVFAGIYLSG